MLSRSPFATPKFVLQKGLCIEKPPANSFFNRAFNAHLDIAEKTYNTQFITGIKNGNLPPFAYGAFTVADSYYTYRSIDALSIAINKLASADKSNPVRDLLIEIRSRYVAFNKFFAKVWRIKGLESINPTQKLIDYVNHYVAVAKNEQPIYLLVAVLPCYHLWFWLGDRLKAYTKNNLYEEWITLTNNPDEAYLIGNFLEEYPQYDEKHALIIYKTSMSFELANFLDGGRFGVYEK